LILHPNLDKLFGLTKGTNRSAMRLHPALVYSRHLLIPLEIVGRTHVEYTLMPDGSLLKPNKKIYRCQHVVTHLEQW
jgi:hypothetical protein